MEDEKRKNRCCLPPGGATPWLVYTYGNDRNKKMQTFCTISSSPPYVQHYLKSIPELRGKEIFFCSGEWLVLRDLDDSKLLSLWNPISSKIIHLPPLIPLEDGVDISCGLLLPCQHDDDYFVCMFGNGVAFCYHNNSWFVQNTEILGRRVDIFDISAVNGILYGIGRVHPEGDEGFFQRKLLMIEVNNGTDLDEPLTLKLLPVEDPDPGFSCDRLQEYFLESCGRLYDIRVHWRNCENRHVNAVIVWELDSRLNKWVQVKCLDGRAFFVGYRCSTWCWGSSESGGDIQGNSVYFVVSDDFGVSNVVYQYNLEDLSLTCLLPCPNFPFRSNYRPMWVMSQCQSLQRFTLPCSHRPTVEKEGDPCQKWEAIQPLQHDDGVVRFSLCELPLDLIGRVAQQLHLFDYLNFRATCKLLNQVAPPIRWRINNSYPLLMYFKNEDPSCGLMDPCRTDSCSMAPPQTFGGAVFIDFSKNGWLVLSIGAGEGHYLELLNPFSGERGKYPPLNRVNTFSSVGFSTCPTSSDCTTIGIVDYFDEIWFWYYHFGDDDWNLCIHEKLHEDDFMPGSSSPVYYEGAFYSLDRRGYLGVFEIMDEWFDWNVYGKPQIPKGHLRSSHLVECDGELLAVFIGGMVGEWVRVFRLERPKMKWAPVKSLGNYTLFVSPSSSFAAKAVEHEMRNRIYLTRQCNNGGILFYSLDTGKYNTLKGEEWITDLTGTKEHTRCCWI